MNCVFTPIDMTDYETHIINEYDPGEIPYNQPNVARMREYQ